MPACIYVLGARLDAKQLEKFVTGLDVTTIGGRKLLLDRYKGTWTFVDKDTYASHFPPSENTSYVIKTKNNLTFGQLLQSVGGQDSPIFIKFTRGCLEIATRPYLREKAK